MDAWHPGLWLGFLSVVGGFAVAFYAIWIDSKKRQLRHTERMAMIEKGLIPTGEGREVYAQITTGSASRRSQRRSGVFMICLGIALSLMFGLSSESWNTVWIGAFIALIGVANLVNALLDDRDARNYPPPASQ